MRQRIPHVTDRLEIVGLALAPMPPQDAMQLAAQLLQKAARRIVIDEAARTVRTSQRQGRPASRRAR